MTAAEVETTIDQDRMRKKEVSFSVEVEDDRTKNKSVSRWPSTIDHQMLQVGSDVRSCKIW